MWLGNVSARASGSTVLIVGTYLDKVSETVSYIIRALASARGSVVRRAQRPRRKPLEGPKGPRVPKTRESEGPKGPRTSKAQCLFWRLPVLLYVFHDSAKNRDFRGTI